jgi:chromosome partitioning protein
MKETSSTSDEEYHRWLEGNAENRCFKQSIPRMSALQDAANFQTTTRSYLAKYPGQAGSSIRALTKEVLERLETTNRQPAEEPTPAEAATG